MSDAFLGIESSVTKKRWVERPYDERTTLALAQRFTLPDILARIMSARCIDLETAASFLDPKLRDLLPDPSLLQDMDKAALRLATALQNAEKIAVYGDYDVDGATSSALLLRFGRAAGSELRLYVPDRMKEGYGPNAAAMQKLASEGINLVICVDCGTTAHDALTAAKDAGTDVIVLDHHASEPALPPTSALVNPNRLDEEKAKDYSYLAAVGVTYLFVVAVNRTLRQAGWYSEARPEPDLLCWLDLVALGTICDVVKLVGLNRAFVTQGLRIMAQGRNPGIVALAQAANLKGPMDTYAAGFVLGPRVNAGGRVGQSDLGAKLLSTDDPVEATQLAEHLNQLNKERRDIEGRVLAEAEAVTVIENLPMAFVYGEKWHPGVIGIVAARLKDKFHHPALVIALEGDVGKGSGRSVHGIDLGAHIIAARQAGLLINGGGHKMAAGFTVARDRVLDLCDFLAERIGRQIAAEPLKPTLAVDGLLASTSFHPDFAKQLKTLGPFGTGNPEPRFALSECRIVQANVVGENHVSVVIMQGGQRLRGIAFRALNTNLGMALMDQGHRICHLAGHLRLDEWQGVERVQFQIDDAALC